MAHFIGSCWLPYDSDDIKADIQIDVISLDICIGSNRERTHFLHGDSLISISKLLILSGLYLNNDQYSVVYCAMSKSR